MKKKKLRSLDEIIAEAERRSSGGGEDPPPPPPAGAMDIEPEPEEEVLEVHEPLPPPPISI